MMSPRESFAATTGEVRHGRWAGGGTHNDTLTRPEQIGRESLSADAPGAWRVWLMGSPRW